jgi:formyltetrahydrofolate-dependent phosphoribosylglycinamide formyltransferase
VLASGTGTLLQSLLDATADPAYPAQVVAVGADTPDAFALTRAQRAGVETFVVPFSEYRLRTDWDAALTDRMSGYAPDWILSAGFMRILGEQTLDRFPGRIINTHPALLPAFPGAHAVRDALAYGVRVTGCTLHIVDPGVDTGPIIAQSPVHIDSGDTEEILHERIKLAERSLVVGTMAAIASRGCVVDGRRAYIP